MLRELTRAIGVLIGFLVALGIEQWQIRVRVEQQIPLEQIDQSSPWSPPPAEAAGYAPPIRDDGRFGYGGNTGGGQSYAPPVRDDGRFGYGSPGGGDAATGGSSGGSSASGGGSSGSPATGSPARSSGGGGGWSTGGVMGGGQGIGGLLVLGLGAFLVWEIFDEL